MGRRKFSRIRREILGALAHGSIRTVNEIAIEIRAKWVTAKRHLDWLEKYGRKVRTLKRTRRLALYVAQG